MPNAEYIGPVCKHVCLACGGCSQCHDGTCIDYEPQEDPSLGGDHA